MRLVKSFLSQANGRNFASKPSFVWVQSFSILTKALNINILCDYSAVFTNNTAVNESFNEIITL